MAGACKARGTQGYAAGLQEHRQSSQPAPHGDGPRLPSPVPHLHQPRPLHRCEPDRDCMPCGPLRGLSCFILNYTDSFHSEGKVNYGLATFGGLWVFDNVPLAPDTAGKYRIRFRDFVHAFMSVLIFMAVVLCERNVVSCFYPLRSENMEQVLAGCDRSARECAVCCFTNYPPWNWLPTFSSSLMLSSSFVDEPTHLDAWLRHPGMFFFSSTVVVVGW